jgi:BirA family biotin operon repressor/biotin-[acetyl-CoA-carboxylase] ligase
MKLKNEAERVHFECISSTQDYAKEKRAEGRSLIVTAAAQSGGKGTKGRSFSSTVGGVYLSKLSVYEQFPAKQAFFIMARAAVAVCETLRFYGLKPLIKWPNDVLVNDKKICGILIDNVFSGQNIVSSVVGIGLNVCNVLPKELCSIATTIQEETGHVYDVEEVTQRLIAELDKEYGMEQYRACVGYMGRQATLIMGSELVHGTLVSVDAEGGLTVEINGELRRLTAAEISVRI